MTRVRLIAPSRLHFGLLARGPRAPRQFGGLGLMVQEPGLEIAAEPASAWQFEGPLAERAGRVAARLVEHGLGASPLAIRILRAPPEHVGLGTGTQLSLAVAKLLATAAGRDLPAPELAALTGRGLRSGVGLHGFDHGGLIVEGGRKADGGPAPLLGRMAFPAGWSALVVVPSEAPGRHGEEETRAFAALPPIPEAETDRLCRLVLLGVLPAVAERDLPAFGAALEEIQHRVGAWFAPAQGGVYASPRVTELADWLRGEGLRGVGQSSWGPTLYGFSDRESAWREALAKRLRERLGPTALVLWTAASQGGARLIKDPGRPEA